MLTVLALFCGLVPGASAETGRKTTADELQPRFMEWLKLVSCIIQPIEKEVFLQLDNDRERDVFIEMFWKQRDPTPGTPVNEYKDEIAERFKYVNRTFGRSTVREGWQTDMGRFYMVLGPPDGIERFETSSFNRALPGLDLLQRRGGRPAEPVRPALLPERGSGRF